jgi:TRAP-type uncharacterized transport system substrate-binding protein
MVTPPQLTELTQDETTVALCRGTIDASFFVVAHPSELISNRLAACASNFVTIREGVVDKQHISILHARVYPHRTLSCSR